MNRIISHIATVIFLACVRTNANPGIWQVAVLAFLFDEVFYLFIKQIRTETERRKTTNKKVG